MIAAPPERQSATIVSTSTSTAPTSPAPASRLIGGLPARDYVILPLLSLFTVVLMLGVSEIATRLMFVARDFDSCLVYNPAVGGRFKPNCTSVTKNAESGWVTNRYNECGYRSAASCGVKPPGTLRVVALGSSFTQGDFVPYDETFTAQASKKLTALCRRPVEFQNLGVEGATPADVARRVQEVISLHPDAVIYPVTPYDLETMPGTVNVSGAGDKNAASNSPLKRAYFFAGQRIRESRTVLVAQHFLFENRPLYVKLFLLYGDKADFLRKPFASAWQNRFNTFDGLIAGMATAFRAAHIPFVITAAPSRAEAAMLNDHTLPARVDPYAFGRAIAAIAGKNQVQYIDLMEPFSRTQNASNLFFPVDGHLKDAGQIIVSEAIVDKLRDGGFPGFGSGY